MELFDAKFLEYSLLVLGIALVSFWLFPKFYFTQSAKRRVQLRLTAIFIEAIALGLFLLMRAPTGSALAGTSGWELLLAGRWDAVLLFTLLAASLAFFFANRSVLIKTGVVLHAFATVFAIIVVGRLAPSFMVGFSDLPLVLLPLTLLAGNVFNLFWWHQLQLQAGTIPSTPKQEIKIWGMNRKQNWTIAAVFVILFGLWISQLYSERTVRHISERYSYSVSMPRSWNVDATQSNYPAEHISSPNGDVLIFIQRLPTPDDVDDVTVRGAIREELEENPYHEPEILQERTWHGYPAYYAEGIYRGDDSEYRFYEHNIFLPDRSVFTARVNVKVSAGDKHQKSIARILDSLVFE